MKTKPVALIADDEPQMLRMLARLLEDEGFGVRTASNGALALQEAVAAKPDVVVLDLGLPDIDGAEVLRELRTWTTLPVLVLSARRESSEKVKLLEGGADDYLEKPFDPEELKARLRALLRRAASNAPADAGFTSGPLRVDFAKRLVTLSETEVELTPTEYTILATLCRDAGKIVTHKALLEAIFGPKASDYREYLRVYMVHLRRKLAAPGAPAIKTVTGVGYRLG